MKSITLEYSDYRKDRLLKYDIPFAIEENTITIFPYKDDSGNEFLSTNKAIDRVNEKDIISALIPVLNRLVYLFDHCHESDYTAYKDKYLFISCYSNYPETIYKNPRNAKYSELHYNGKKCKNDSAQSDSFNFDLPEFCVPFRDDDDLIIGHFSYNRIDFHFDIFHCPLKKLHLELIKAVVNLYLKIEDQLRELYQYYESIKVRLELTSFIKKQADHEKVVTKEDINKLDRNIEEYKSTLLSCYSQLRNLHLKLKGLETETINPEEEVEKLIEAYNIKFSPEGFWFETEDIYYKDIFLGKYKITIDVNAGKISIINLKKKIGSYDHPHIDSGKICLGELNSAIAKLMSEYKYFDVAKLCSELLYFYNKSSAYMPIERWIEG